MKLIALGLLAIVTAASSLAHAAIGDFECSAALLQPFPTTSDKLTVAPDSTVVTSVIRGSVKAVQGFGFNVQQLSRDPLYSQYALVPALDPNNFAVGVAFSRTDANGKPLPQGLYNVTISDNNNWPSVARLVGASSFAINQSVVIPGVAVRGQVVVTCLKR